jgi:hypothetical protein
MLSPKWTESCSDRPTTIVLSGRMVWMWLAKQQLLRLQTLLERSDHFLSLSQWDTKLLGLCSLVGKTNPFRAVSHSFELRHSNVNYFKSQLAAGSDLN